MPCKVSLLTLIQKCNGNKIKLNLHFVIQPCQFKYEMTFKVIEQVLMINILQARNRFFWISLRHFKEITYRFALQRCYLSEVIGNTNTLFWFGNKRHIFQYQMNTYYFD